MSCSGKSFTIALQLRTRRLQFGRYNNRCFCNVKQKPTQAINIVKSISPARVMITRSASGCTAQTLVTRGISHLKLIPFILQCSGTSTPSLAWRSPSAVIARRQAGRSKLSLEHYAVRMKKTNSIIVNSVITVLRNKKPSPWTSSPVALV